ncbi:putative damage-inducible protein DinB [Kibdelosporangium banguiense]|uniref:Damage-inducible protein DinB n=1 Tax=Kibdelosporangium banguiense TaxID=1365924 RepID=A0ABS4TZN4_9PSEU|nr:DinB family protein [Kibdelosporangium banguiense]MBP2329853.1 putative damage-inducible protein DinB [Kibdelosporangium banguiense]
MVIRVPPTGGEKESLLAAMWRHREAVLWKIQGLDDEQLRRKMTPSGTHLLGLVKHLASVEYGWFCEPFGRESKAVFKEDDPEFDLQVRPGETTEGIVAFYREACAAADAVVNEVELTEIGTSWDGDKVTMRWVLIHMIEETARHAGHMDIIRELIDGAAGDHPWEEDAQTAGTP